MSKVVLFPQAAGPVAVFYPMEVALSVMDNARKCVPAGVPFLIADAADIPDDPVFRLAWEADFSQPHGFGVGLKAWFTAEFEARIAEIGAEVAPEAPEAELEPDATTFAAPEGATKKEKADLFRRAIAEVRERNAQATAQHSAQLHAWEADKAARIAEIEAAISALEEDRP